MKAIVRDLFARMGKINALTPYLALIPLAIVAYQIAEPAPWVLLVALATLMLTYHWTVVRTYRRVQGAETTWRDVRNSCTR